MVGIGSTFRISRQTPLVIYGASYIGTVTGEALLANGYNVICFIDQRARDIKSCLGKPVLSLDQCGGDSAIDKENTAVIIAVKNVFYHEEIAVQLVRHGFHNLIYKTQESISEAGETGQSSLDRAYEAVYKKGNILDLDVPCTYEKKANEPDRSFLKIDAGSYKTILVPAALVYTGITAQAWSDICILALLPHIRLFEFFEGLDCGECGSYLALCAEGAENAGLETTESWREYVLTNRKDIYERMCNYLEFEPGFFERSAPLCTYNSGGYFNLQTGKHRAAFLAAKGLRYIPVKVSDEDYRRYISAELAEQFSQYLVNERIDSVYSPILHPFFYRFKCDNNSFFHTFLKKLTALIWTERPNRPWEKFLQTADFLMDNGFVSRAMNAMKFHVVRFTEDGKTGELARWLDRLSGTAVEESSEAPDLRNRFDLILFNAYKCRKVSLKDLLAADYHIMIAIVPKGSSEGQPLFSGLLDKALVDVVVIRRNEERIDAELGYRV